MSWSISLIGKPENVAKSIEAYGDGLNGQCREEYDAAMPHLAGLVRQNFADESAGYMTPVIKIAASGTGTSKGGSQIHRHCSVSIDVLYSQLV